MCFAGEYTKNGEGKKPSGRMEEMLVSDKGNYEILREKYGDWVTRAQIKEFSGLKVANRSNAWAIQGVERKRNKPMGTKGASSIVYKLSSVLRNIEEHTEKDLSRKGIKARQKLCRTCRWRSTEASRGNDAIYCAYCLQIGHHTKHWHKEHGIPNALDMLHCPFYEKGDSERLPMSEWIGTEKIGSVTESEKH